MKRIFFRQDAHMARGRMNAGDAAPSQRWIEIRERKRKICDMIHNSTWLIETFVQVSGVLIQFLSLNMDSYLLQSIHDTIGLLFARIVVPLTSLFSEQKIRVAILERGWIYAIKVALKIERLSNVQPLENNHRSARSNENNVSKHVPQAFLKNTFSNLNKINPRHLTNEEMKMSIRTTSPAKSSREQSSPPISESLNSIRAKNLPNTFPDDLP